MNSSPKRKGSLDQLISHSSPPRTTKASKVTASPEASISTYKFIATPPPNKDKKKSTTPKHSREKGETLKILEVRSLPELVAEYEDEDINPIQIDFNALDVSPLIMSDSEEIFKELELKSLMDMMESFKTVHVNRNQEFVENQRDIVELIEIAKKETEKCVEAHVKNSLELDKFLMRYDEKKMQEVDLLQKEVKKVQANVFSYIHRLENIEATLDSILAAKYMKEKNPHDGPVLPLEQLFK